MKKIIFLILLVFLFTSCSEKQEVKVHKYYKTAKVSTGIVNENDNFIAYTRGIKQAMLAPKMPGRITLMTKNIGDKVWAGTLLANLDSAEAINGYNTANNIVNSLLRLKRNTISALNKQISAMEKKIESIKAQANGVDKGLIDTKNITQSQIETAKKGLETAKANLEQTKKELQAKKQAILTGAKSSLTYTNTIIMNSYDFVENLLGMDKTNDEFYQRIKDYLGTRNIMQRNKTKQLFEEIRPLYNDYRDFYVKKIQDKEVSEKDLIEGLQKAKIVLEKFKELLNSSYTTIDNSIENVYFPAEMINNLKTQNTNLLNNVEKTLLSTDGDMLLGVKGSIENLNNFNASSKKAIDLLEKQVEIAEKQLQTAKNAATGQMNNVATKKEVMDLGVAEAIAGLEALKAKKEATIKELDAKISEAIGKRNEASVMINNGKVIAPFSGIVVNKMGEEGQVTNAGMPLYEIADNSKIKIKISVPNEIKEKLHIGDKIEVLIDGVDKTQIGTISNISLAANPITKKYEIELILDNKDRKIPVGAMAVVSFNTDFKVDSKENNSIRIPNEAIIEKFMIPGVYVVENKKAKFKKIKILKMGEYYSQITGLNPGETIITQGKENIYDGEILK